MKETDLDQDGKVNLEEFRQSILEIKANRKKLEEAESSGKQILLSYLFVFMHASHKLLLINFMQYLKIVWSGSVLDEGERPGR